MSEKIYDDEIAPALAKVAERCKAAGMHLVATVEYEPGKRASTYMIDAEACLELTMEYMLSKAAPNIDSFMISLMRHCLQHGIDTSASMFLTRFGPSSGRAG